MSSEFVSVLLQSAQSLSPGSVKEGAGFAIVQKALGRYSAKENFADREDRIAKKNAIRSEQYCP
jgi:hypothetical protein